MTTKRVWKGNPLLKKFLVPIADVKPNPNNARRHVKKDIGATARSLDDHGQQVPLVVADDMMLIAGEGRWLAAQQLGWTHLAVVASDIKDDGERRLYAIRDNRTAELSSWDLEQLSQQLQALSDSVDLQALGLWESYELDPLLNAEWKPPEDSEPPGDPGDTSVGGSPEMASPIKLTVEQREVFARAMTKLIEQLEEDEGERPDLTEGRALELICADWMS